MGVRGPLCATTPWGGPASDIPGFYFVMTVTVLFAPSFNYAVPASYYKNFLPGRSRTLQIAVDDKDLAHKVHTCDSELLYIITNASECTNSVGRGVLPGLYYGLVRQEGVFYGGKTDLVKLAYSGEESVYRIVTEEDTGIVPSVENSISVLVAVLSCHKNKDKQDACRNTWCSCLPDNVDYRIYVGTGSSVQEGKDVVKVQYADDYQSVPGKQLEFYKWALNNLSFEWLFQVDDDTYVAPDRIFNVLDPEYDMIGTLMHEEIMHGGIGYFIHRRLLKRMCEEESELWLSGNGDWQFTKLARKLNARIKNVQMGYMVYSNNPWPNASNIVVTTHYVTPDIMQVMHKRYMDSIGFYERKSERIAVVGLFVGSYFGLIEDWYRNMEEYLDTSRKKDYFIITDKSEEEVHAVIKDAKVYYKCPENRIWFLMLNKSLLLMAERELRHYNTVVYVQSNARWTREKKYRELKPSGSAYWRSMHSIDYYPKAFYMDGEHSGAPFVKDFPFIDSYCAPWITGMVVVLKGFAVYNWANYFMQCMQECWDLGIYPPWHEESLLNRMAYGRPGTCNLKTLFFNPDGSADLIVVDKTHLGIRHHDGYTRPEQDVTY